MAIFLKVLSIIGIVLLSILAFILLILLIVLFVPIRYRVEGSFKDNKPTLIAKVTWLLHIVSVKYHLGEEEPLTIKIFGFKLKQKKEKEPDFDEEDEDYGEGTYNMPQLPGDDVKPEPAQEPIAEHVPESIPEEVHESSQEVVQEAVSEEAEETVSTPVQEPETEPEKRKKRKIAEKHKKEKPQKKDFENQSFYDKIKKYIEIIESKRFKKAFEFSKKKIFKLLKHIRPRRIDIKGEVGFEDPSLTGTVIAITSMLIPVFGNSVRITGNFEEPVISVDGYLKGHITIFRVLWTLAVLYFNKDLRKIIKMFREV